MDEPEGKRPRVRRPCDNPYFWGPAIQNITIWDCIENGRSQDLRHVLEGHPPNGIGTGIGPDVNARHYHSGLTPLETCVTLGHVKCAEILAEAGARGAADILRRITGAGSKMYDALRPYMTLQEVRDVEGIWTASEHQSQALGVRLVTDRNAFPQLRCFIQEVGCDSVRTRRGESLEDLARAVDNWPAEFFFHRRCIYTFMLCQRYGHRHGSSLPQLPRDVAWLVARHYFFAAEFCVHCGKAYPRGSTLMFCTLGQCLKYTGRPYQLRCGKCPKDVDVAPEITCSRCHIRWCPTCCTHRCDHVEPHMEAPEICNQCWDKGLRECGDCSSIRTYEDRVMRDYDPRHAMYDEDGGGENGDDDGGPSSSGDLSDRSSYNGDGDDGGDLYEHGRSSEYSFDSAPPPQ